MPKNNVFQRVGGLRPPRSMFNLSYEKKFTCDMGQLIPVMCDEIVPGDFIQLGNEAVVRCQPLVAPVLHEVNMYVHYFFVPYRLLWDDWEDFITGGEDGQNADTLPTWNPSAITSGSLWDFLGFPMDQDPGATYAPMSFPRDAYNLIYNEYYRDQTLQTEIALTAESILQRNWEKDYFTSALPWQQRGTAPALPISGTTSAVWETTQFRYQDGSDANAQFDSVNSSDYDMAGTTANHIDNMYGFMNANTVDLSGASTFDVADLRVAFQIQKWMERNARAGARYTEFLKSHFGVSPRDERLQRPEYVGGSKAPVIFSEVLQTSENGTTPQGNLAGHGISVSDSYCGKYHAKEYGLLMGLMSIMPRSLYQQGINRQWLRSTRYDFFFPEFANLSEQAIENREIYLNGSNVSNEGIFGYQGRYDEMRIKQNMVCSQMRDTFDYWHMSRQFGNTPVLNDGFLQCVPRKDIYAVDTDPGLIVSFGNIIKAARPLPISSEPGLIDHN